MKVLPALVPGVCVYSCCAVKATLLQLKMLTRPSCSFTMRLQVEPHGVTAGTEVTIDALVAVHGIRSGFILLLDSARARYPISQCRRLFLCLGQAWRAQAVAIMNAVTILNGPIPTLSAL